nr:hypothetical protein [Escherichia coli]
MRGGSYELRRLKLLLACLKISSAVTVTLANGDKLIISPRIIIHRSTPSPMPYMRVLS